MAVGESRTIRAVRIMWYGPTTINRVQLSHVLSASHRCKRLPAVPKDSVAPPSLSLSSLMSLFSNSLGINTHGGTFYSAGGDANIQNNQQLVNEASEMQAALGQESTSNPRIGWEGAPPSAPIRNNRTQAEERFIPYGMRPFIFSVTSAEASQISIHPMPAIDWLSVENPPNQWPITGLRRR